MTKAVDMAVTITTRNIATTIGAIIIISAPGSLLSMSVDSLYMLMKEGSVISFVLVTDPLTDSDQDVCSLCSVSTVSMVENARHTEVVLAVFVVVVISVSVVVVIALFVAVVVAVVVALFATVVVALFIVAVVALFVAVVTEVVVVAVVSNVGITSVGEEISKQ